MIIIMAIDIPQADSETMFECNPATHDRFMIEWPRWAWRWFVEFPVAVWWNGHWHWDVNVNKQHLGCLTGEVEQNICFRGTDESAVKKAEMIHPELTLAM